MAAMPQSSTVEYVEAPRTMQHRQRWSEGECNALKDAVVAQGGSLLSVDDEAMHKVDWNAVSDAVSAIPAGPAGGRSHKQCREKWKNSPKLRTGQRVESMSAEDEVTLVVSVAVNGGVWAQIAATALPRQSRTGPTPSVPDSGRHHHQDPAVSACELFPLTGWRQGLPGGSSPFGEGEEGLGGRPWASGCAKTGFLGWLGI